MITPKIISDAQGNERMTLSGHLGTHFDVMDQVFPLEYVRRNGIVFDVRNVKNRDIAVGDIDTLEIREGTFVAFYTGFVETEGYGGKRYFSEHPQLSNELIDILIDRKVAIIGIDFAGVRRGKEHTPKDQYCADHGIFIVENLCNLGSVLGERLFRQCIVNTYPVNYSGMTGLPCRVVAEV
jgi:kynurenine formamidase